MREERLVITKPLVRTEVTWREYEEGSPHIDIDLFDRDQLSDTYYHVAGACISKEDVPKLIRFLIFNYWFK